MLVESGGNLPGDRGPIHRGVELVDHWLRIRTGAVGDVHPGQIVIDGNCGCERPRHRTPSHYHPRSHAGIPDLAERGQPGSWRGIEALLAPGPFPPAHPRDEGPDGAGFHVNPDLEITIVEREIIVAS